MSVLGRKSLPTVRPGRLWTIPQLLTRSNLNLAILNRMTIQKAIEKATIRGHCGQCRELYLATALQHAAPSHTIKPGVSSDLI